MRGGRLGKAVLAAVLVLGAGCATTESAVEPASTPTPTPTVVGSFEWTSAQVPYALHFVVRAGDGFVAMEAPAVMAESEEDQAMFRVMSSPDGLTWTPADGAPTGEFVMWENGGPWGAAARIESAEDPGSADILYTPDGVQWVRSGLVDEDGTAYAGVQDVAVGESGLVVAAAGSRAVLFSEDGRTWQKVDLGVPKFRAAEVIAADPGFVVISENKGWLYSPDGRSGWKQYDLAEGMATGERYGFSVGTSTGWREGFMILRSGPEGPRIVLSQDGTSWTDSDAAELAGLGRVSLL